MARTDNEKARDTQQTNLLDLIWQEIRRTNEKLDELKGITLGKKNAK